VAKGRASRDRVAAGLARGVATMARAVGAGGGSSLPGMVAERLSPGFIGRRAAQLPGGVVVVSGTNGKTTTASMIRTILRATGDPTVGNETGANLRQGVASALLHIPARARTAVFEVDEAALPAVVDELQPRMLVLTNVFRDQLDRYGEAERVVSLLGDAARRLPADAVVVANADDGTLFTAVESRAPVGFGVALPPTAGDGSSGDGSVSVEAEVCPRCGTRLRYKRRTISHLGTARCPAGDWASTAPAFLADVVARDGLRSVTVEMAQTRFTVPTGGIHNAYNAAAAVAATSVLGVPIPVAADALRSFRARFGRIEELMVDGRGLWLTLMKNPAAADVLITELAADPGVGAVVVVLNDAAADGRDVSWIWDVDFERMAGGVPMIPSGHRVDDMAVRLKYAEVTMLPGDLAPRRAIETAFAACAKERTPVVLATYTAMLDVRAAVTGRAARLTDLPS
jgi:lipid II isoglutaminyl synthase (glutamine-hydrolysing)